MPSVRSYETTSAKMKCYTKDDSSFNNFLYIYLVKIEGIACFHVIDQETR